MGLMGFLALNSSREDACTYDQGDFPADSVSECAVLALQK